MEQDKVAALKARISELEAQLKAQNVEASPPGRKPRRAGSKPKLPADCGPWK